MTRSRERGRTPPDQSFSRGTQRGDPSRGRFRWLSAMIHGTKPISLGRPELEHADLILRPVIVSQWTTGANLPGRFEPIFRPARRPGYNFRCILPAASNGTFPTNPKR